MADKSRIVDVQNATGDRVQPVQYAMPNGACTADPSRNIPVQIDSTLDTTRYEQVNVTTGDISRVRGIKDSNLSFYAPLETSTALVVGTGSPTFTRATTAYVMGYSASANLSDGQTLILCNAGEARFSGARRISAGNYASTFSDGTLIPKDTLKGYLAEPVATNICLQSNGFTTTWTAVGTPDPVQNQIGITGAVNEAWTLTDNSAVAMENVTQTVILTAASYTFSIFIKKTSGAQSAYPIIWAYTGTTIALCTVDTSNGIATSWTAYTGFTMLANISARCTSINANFWRVELTFTGTAASYTFSILPAGTTNATQSTGVYDVSAQGSAVIQGAQIELGSFATSYIPTTTIAVQRNADVLTYPSSGNIVTLSDYSLYAEWSLSGISVGVNQVAVGSNVLYRPFIDVGTGSTTVVGYWTDTGGVVSTVSLPTASKLSTTNKVATRKDATNHTIAGNGAIGTNTAIGTQGAEITTINIGNAVTLVQLNGNIKNVRIWQTQLSDATLKAITT